MHYNWAAENPGRVACIAGIYPVCDLRSWPGLAQAAPAYGMTEQALSMHLAEHDPIDRLAPLAKAACPFFISTAIATTWFLWNGIPVSWPSVTVDWAATSN